MFIGGYTKIWHQVQGCFSTFDICTHIILSKVIIFFSNPLNKICNDEIDPHMQKHNESFRKLPSYVSQKDAKVGFVPKYTWICTVI